MATELGSIAESQRQMTRIFGEPSKLQRVFEDQRRMDQMLKPLLPDLERMAKLFNGSTFDMRGMASMGPSTYQRLLDSQRRYEELFSPSVIQRYLDQQRMLGDLFRSPAFVDWLSTSSARFAESLNQNLMTFRQSVFDQMFEVVDDGPQGGDEALSLLTDQRAEIITLLKRTSEVATAMGLAGLPMPHVVLALLLVVYVLGEVADEILTDCAEDDD